MNTDLASAISKDSEDFNVKLRYRPVKASGSSHKSLDVIKKAASRLLREEMKAVRTEMQEYSNTIASLVATAVVCNDTIDNLTIRTEATKTHQLEP
ncbi:hypothetical protein EVAR_324_1 [Eumeta japonica]|uniref:Uncharacterized protein n=1 Tax=Eumeta variegata TaxID=151549 RepID=A0A4C1SCJ6_EUMVA|nr:hypothetical protein EVAR_324_1 [Eumeta japonica]